MRCSPFRLEDVADDFAEELPLADREVSATGAQARRTGQPECVQADGAANCGIDSVRRNAVDDS